MFSEMWAGGGGGRGGKGNLPATHGGTIFCGLEFGIFTIFRGLEKRGVRVCVYVWCVCVCVCVGGGGGGYWPL